MQQQQQQQQQQQPPLSVERLDLGLTNISDACADALLAVMDGRFTRLRAIGLALTGISAGLLQKLKECSIQHETAQDGTCPAGRTKPTSQPPLYHQVSLDIRGTVRRC